MSFPSRTEEHRPRDIDSDSLLHGWQKAKVEPGTQPHEHHGVVTVQLHAVNTLAAKTLVRPPEERIVYRCHPLVASLDLRQAQGCHVV